MPSPNHKRLACHHLLVGEDEEGVHRLQPKEDFRRHRDDWEGTAERSSRRKFKGDFEHYYLMTRCPLMTRKSYIIHYIIETIIKK